MGGGPAFQKSSWGCPRPVLWHPFNGNHTDMKLQVDTGANNKILQILGSDPFSIAVPLKTNQPAQEQQIDFI